MFGDGLASGHALVDRWLEKLCNEGNSPRPCIGQKGQLSRHKRTSQNGDVLAKDARTTSITLREQRAHIGTTTHLCVPIT